jgi:hypothetical protein
MIRRIVVVLLLGGLLSGLLFVTDVPPLLGVLFFLLVCVGEAGEWALGMLTSGNSSAGGSSRLSGGEVKTLSGRDEPLVKSAEEARAHAEAAVVLPVESNPKRWH